MAKCPKDDCKSTEFEIEKIEVKGYMQLCSVIVCKDCRTIIGIAPSDIISKLTTIKGKLP